MFQPISLIWFIQLVKSHRWIESTQNLLSNGEVPTVLASIVKKLQMNIYKLPPEEIMKMAANNQPMFLSFSNANLVGFTSLACPQYWQMGYAVSSHVQTTL